MDLVRGVYHGASAGEAFMVLIGDLDLDTGWDTLIIRTMATAAVIMEITMAVIMAVIMVMAIMAAAVITVAEIMEVTIPIKIKATVSVDQQEQMYTEEIIPKDHRQQQFRQPAIEERAHQLFRKAEQVLQEELPEPLVQELRPQEQPMQNRVALTQAY